MSLIPAAADSTASASPVPIPNAKKRTIGHPSKPAPEGDHRKRRRNRTTQSCLNCHTSKRMCDRKRPCGRCTQLGLVRVYAFSDTNAQGPDVVVLLRRGLCVFEVDDPDRDDASDETSRLQKRVAELEGVIRDLKNKPHPRWTQSSSSPALTPDKWHTRAGASARSRSVSTVPESVFDGKNSPPSSNSSRSTARSSSSTPSPETSPYFPGQDSPSPGSSPSSVSATPTEEAPTVPLIAGEHHHHSIPMDFDFSALLSLSPANTLNAEANYLETFLDRLIPSDGLKTPLGAHTPDHGSGGHSGNHCGCLAQSSEYQVMLELSFRLRKAADTLRRSSNHLSGTECAVLRRISEWDVFAHEQLAQVPIHDNDVSPFALNEHSNNFAQPMEQVVRPSPHDSPPQETPVPIVTRPTRLELPRSASYPAMYDDSLMSWNSAQAASQWQQSDFSAGYGSVYAEHN